MNPEVPVTIQFSNLREKAQDGRRNLTHVDRNILEKVQDSKGAKH